MVKSRVESTETTPATVWERSASRPPVTLPQLADKIVREVPDQSALYLRHLRSTQTNTEYLSLTFKDFANEQEAWVVRLLDEGIRAGDRVLVWLPSGLAFLAATYALMRIGVKVILLDHRFNWKLGRLLVQEQSPRYMLGSPDAVACTKGLFSGLSGLKKRITVSDPFQRMASKVPPARRLRFNEVNSDLIYIETPSNGMSLATRFGSSQLVEMAKFYAEQFSVEAPVLDLSTGNSLLFLLNPARGYGSVSTENVLGVNYKTDHHCTASAIEHLSVSSMFAEASVWESVVSECIKSNLMLPSLKRVLVAGFSVTNSELDAIQAIAPNAVVHRVLGIAGCPIVSERTHQVGQVQNDTNVGRLLSGFVAKVEPLNGGWNSSKANAGSEVGKLFLSGVVIGNPNEWSATPVIGYVDSDNQIHCFAKANEVVQTSYGTFVSPRCERVFEEHPNAKKVALVALKKNGKTRPGLVVETSAEDLPRSAVEKSRFKAQLLCLGALSEETSLVMDIFFTRKFPQGAGGFLGVDREFLSETYSRRIAH